MSQFQSLMVATDFSPHGDAAVKSAVELAKTFSATLHLFHAFDIPVPMVTPYEIAVPTGFLDQARDAARERLQAMEEKIKAEGVEVRAHLSESPAAHAIAHAAEELGVDLIVMGTRGNTGLKHVLLGSVAERTLRLAPCSVLTIKTEDEG